MNPPADAEPSWLLRRKQPFVFSQRFAIVASLALFLGVLCVAADESGFRRFADTISPDGAYVFAWGWGEDEHPEKLKEWSPGQDTAEDFVANYLVDAVRGQVLTTIPERDHFLTSDGRWKQFSGLSVAWSEDSEHALAIYEGRWSDEAILWIRPKMRSFVDVRDDLDSAYRRFLLKKEKVEDAGEISFGLPALLPGGVVVVDARARPQVNKPPEYNYLLKFLVKSAGDEVKCSLVSGRKIPQPQGDIDEEDELNRAYRQLRAKLDEADRAALKTRQLQWLKQREALGDKSAGSLFTRFRATYLRARAEN